MSARYEMAYAYDLPIRLAPTGEDFGHGDIFDTPALVLGNPDGTALVVPGTVEELLEVVETLRGLLSPAGDDTARVEVVVDRDPDGGTDVRVWLDAREVTGLPHTHIAVVDPGAGWARTDWDDDAELATERLTAEPKAALLALKEQYDESEHITD